MIGSGCSRPRPPATVRVGCPRRLQWVRSVLRLLHLAPGQDCRKNHPTGTPAAWLATQGPGEGFQRMDGGQQRGRAARSPGQIISFGCGSEGTAGTRAPTRREAEIYIAAAEVHLRREIPPPDGYQVWHG
jgi:hypothetical protein